MTRATTKERTRPYRCKLCDSVGIGWHGASERSVIQHVLMTYGAKDKNSVHKTWKTSHNQPIMPPMKEMNQNITIVMKNWGVEICELCI